MDCYDINGKTHTSGDRDSSIRNVEIKGTLGIKFKRLLKNGNGITQKLVTSGVCCGIACG